jgi:hypothetical protein
LCFHITGGNAALVSDRTANNNAQRSYILIAYTHLCFRYFQQWAAPLEAEGIELWSICLPGRAFRVFEGAQDPPDGYVLPEPEEEEEEEYDVSFSVFSYKFPLHLSALLSYR